MTNTLNYFLNILKQGEYPFDMALEPKIWNSFLEKARKFVANPMLSDFEDKINKENDISIALSQPTQATTTILDSQNKKIGENKVNTNVSSDKKNVKEKADGFEPKTETLKPGDLLNKATENKLVEYNQPKTSKKIDYKNEWESILEASNCETNTERSPNNALSNYKPLRAGKIIYSTPGDNEYDQNFEKVIFYHLIPVLNLIF